MTSTNVDDSAIAEAYRQFAALCEGRSIFGEPMPKWEELSDEAKRIFAESHRNLKQQR